MSSLLIKNGTVVNEGRSFQADLLIEHRRIKKIIPANDRNQFEYEYLPSKVIDASGKFVLPGIIDDQVHFRDPGLNHKADFFTESRAAVAGGVTSVMDMPNTIPNTLTQNLLEEKFEMIAEKSLVNFSCYMGVSNDNTVEVLKTDPRSVCGIKIFLGASTGNMLVDNEKTLDALFEASLLPIAVHCEDEGMIRKNTKHFREKFGEGIAPSFHPLIRSAEACYRSSASAVERAVKYNTRLHLLHISTGRELALFDKNLNITDKRITAEVCIHHLWFDDQDYQDKGNLIKWNPAVKTPEDKEALRAALIPAPSM